VPGQVPDIRLAKAFRGLCLPGTRVQITLQVTNVGTGPTSDPVTLNDPMPAGLTLVLPVPNPPGWDCSASTPALLSCEYGVPPVLNPGGSAPLLVVTVQVAPDAPPVIINTAQATTLGDLDPSLGIDSAFCRREPVPAPVLGPFGYAGALLALLGAAGFGWRRLRSGRAGH
jgi:hypothetical protein